MHKIKVVIEDVLAIHCMCVVHWPSGPKAKGSNTFALCSCNYCFLLVLIFVCHFPSVVVAKI